MFPKEIILETTNFCNLRCKFCHFHGINAPHKRKKGYMKPHIWERVLAELNSISKNHTSHNNHDITLCFHGAGEPLLHPELRQMLLSARVIEGLSIGFMTNGMLLSMEWAEFLIDLPLDWLSLSIDTANEAINNSIRVGSDLMTVSDNVKRLIELKARKGSELPRLHFNMVAYPQVSERDISEYVMNWIDGACNITVSRFRPVSSKRLIEYIDEGVRDRVSLRPCPLLYRQMVIGWDGRVGLCCEDIFIDECIGNVLTESIEDIFNGEPIMRIRRLHQEGRKEDVPLCRECDVWAGDIVIREEDIVLGDRVVRKKEMVWADVYEG